MIKTAFESKYIRVSALLIIVFLVMVCLLGDSMVKNIQKEASKEKMFAENLIGLMEFLT